MASIPQYTASPKNSVAQVTTADTSLTSVAGVTILTAGASGARVDQILIKAAGTTTAGMIRLFISDGTSHRLIKEIPVIAITPSASIPSWEAQVDFYNGLLLQANWVLKATTEKTETFNIITTQAGDF